MNGDAHCIVYLDAVGVTVCCVKGSFPNERVNTKGGNGMCETQVIGTFGGKEIRTLAIPGDGCGVYVRDQWQGCQGSAPQSPEDSRPNWDDYFLGIARAVAARGECTRSQVGAVLVKGKRIRSTGYNGAPSGAPSCLTGACPRATSNAVPGVSSYAEGPTACIAIHAEANALLFASKDDCSNATLYITRAPCSPCERLILGAGVSTVVTPEGVYVNTGSTLASL